MAASTGGNHDSGTFEEIRYGVGNGMAGKLRAFFAPVEQGISMDAVREALVAAFDAVPHAHRMRRERAIPVARPTRAQAESEGVEVREAGVVWALYPGAEGVHGVLMVRTARGGVHAGQVSMPGGAAEAGDADLTATGLREFAEELGVALDRSAVVGALTPLYIPPSRFYVEAAVAVLEEAPRWAPDPEEVARVLACPCEALVQPGALQPVAVTVGGGMRAPMPAYRVDGEVVWGATAVLLAEFSEIWAEARRRLGMR
jgi:8-oxo-dGTP pyrophosphatase MutT (NUDIX family)